MEILYICVCVCVCVLSWLTKTHEEQRTEELVAVILQQIREDHFYTDFEYEVFTEVAGHLISNGILTGDDVTQSNILMAYHIGYMFGLDTGIKEVTMCDGLEQEEQTTK